MGKQQDHASVLRSMLQPDDGCQCAECAALTAAISALTVDEALVERFCVAFFAGRFPTKAEHNDNVLRSTVRAALQTAIHGETEGKATPVKKLCKVCQKRPCQGGFDHCCDADCIPF